MSNDAATAMRNLARALRRVSLSTVEPGYHLAMFMAKMKHGPRRHGAIKHVRDTRRAQRKRLVREFYR